MIETDDEILVSAPSEPDDDFWLEQGRKMLADSLASVRTAAGELMKGLGILQGLYLGILGFTEFVPKTFSVVAKFFFIVPLLLWLVALYHCLKVMMTEAAEVNLNAPGEVRGFYGRLLCEKQAALQQAFWWLFGGLVFGFVMVVFRLKM